VKYVIDLDRCQDHGQCVFAAPQLFSLDDEGKLSLRHHASGEYESGEIPDDLVDHLEEAASICPVQAIELIDD
jgi:ferredoxin